MTLRRWPAESRTYTDRVTGVTVRQLTDYRGHSNHLYFTNPGWWDRGRRLLFESDRDNACNLFSLDLHSGQITQITDERAATDFQGAYLNPVRDEAYFWRGDELAAVDLNTGAQRRVFRAPGGFVRSGLSVTADGVYACTALRQKVDFEDAIDLSHGYVGFRELFEAHPVTRIVRVPVDGGEAQTLHEETNWITHVNASPTRAHLLTFCHEGPWHCVAQRMWGLDTNRPGEPWAIRPQAPHESMGHEYWMADGERLGYHGWRDAEGRDTVFGSIRYDNADRIEAPFPDHSQHFHSHDLNLIVGDGDPHVTGQAEHVLLWRFDGERFIGPRALCTHRASRHIQRAHVHPRFSPDGSQVLYTSDASGYCNVMLVDVPPFEQLPAVEGRPLGPAGRD